MATPLDQPTIYQRLIACGVPADHMDSHESDLYVKRTAQTEPIVNAAYYRGDFSTVTTFRSQIDGTAWYDIPFAYDPFWDAVRRRANAQAKA